MIEAGRYLNDKEFCYLGTVKVTADVYVQGTKWHWSQTSHKK